MSTIQRIHVFITTTQESRYNVLDRRDEIVSALSTVGLRLVMTDSGTDVYMADDGVDAGAVPEEIVSPPRSERAEQLAQDLAKAGADADVAELTEIYDEQQSEWS